MHPPYSRGNIEENTLYSPCLQHVQQDPQLLDHAVDCPCGDVQALTKYEEQYCHDHADNDADNPPNRGATLFGSRKLDAAPLRGHQQQPVDLQACTGQEGSQKNKLRIFRK